LHACSYWTAFWVFAGGNLALLLLASSITAFVSPAAGGSGIPEVKAYLNGVDAPNIFSLRTRTWPPHRCQLSCAPGLFTLM
jgi:chloride channel 7